ncbi:MAG: hypothetical protein KGK15_18135, partial [Burkholderiales bacterium]|nr:hypothetical protein [Burkholderiales bacterium]
MTSPVNVALQSWFPGSQELVRTRFGIEFDPNADVWPIDGRQSIDAAGLWPLVSAELQPGLKQTIRTAAAKYSWATLHQFAFAIRHLRKAMFDGPVSRWNIADFRQYRDILLKEFGHEDYLRSIRSLLLLWYQGRWPGVDKHLIDALKAMRLKGTQVGRAVRVGDDGKGPLTEQELYS